MRHSLITVLLVVFTISVVAQNDSINTFKIQGYGELYYSYDFSNPQNGEKPNFIYNHKRHDEVNINLTFLKASYNKDYLRANAAIMFGDYSKYNLSSEPSWAQLIYEANVGFKISKKQKLWLDVGVMPSHIGFESAMSSDCWTLTRSILAENSPYFETGIKLSYTNKSERFNTSLLVLNGWQRIYTPNSINSPSFGLQLNYKPNDKFTLNYSNFIGADKVNDIKYWRLYHNLYAIFEASTNLGVIVGLDFGSDKFNTANYSVWYSPIFILRYRINEKYKWAIRGEYFNDKKENLIKTNTQNGFQTFGISSNFDIHIKDNLVWRIEGKEYYSKDKIFNNNRDNFTLTTSLAIKFN